MRPLSFYHLLVLTSTFISCSEQGNKEESSSPRIKNSTSLSEPTYNSIYNIGDSISFIIDLNNTEVGIDSIQIKTDKQGWRTESKTYKLSSGKLSPGKNYFDVTIFLNNQKSEQKRVQVILKSDITPKPYTYQVIDQRPHDSEAFVQGLFFDNGKLYESSGQWSLSYLREVDPNSGQTINKTQIKDQYFGEGSTVIGDEIYMLTWKSNTGLVFDKESLKPIREFNYPTEGWGLTTKDDTLIMSDGTEILRFMESTGFTEVKSIEVYDNKHAIDNLNELEFIDGYIYANRWTTDWIYKIDPTTGKVLAKIDLSGLIDRSNYDFEIDVLNGIAYDKNTNKIYVTGKNWPLLFEVEFIEQQNNI